VVLRKALRNVTRPEATEFHDARDEQPMPRLGAWRELLDGLLAANGAKPSRERLWRSAKCEEVYLRSEDSVRDARVSPGSGWQHEEAARAVRSPRSGCARPA
jgi:hypothetical protein